ncbi:hypothetical protein [Bdellovibrio sp. NC01]|uniref:hypothetical protein n=1 Tax=Bdellovibrio sp. NC01 TaxID=2220073 RepID=UPI001159AB98|nr:hypothetical protein [Bdellovibrio sp. NC01]
MNSILRGISASTMATSSTALGLFQLFGKISGKKHTEIIPTEPQEQKKLLERYGYGALFGVAYATVASRLPINPLAKGALFGLGLWAGGKYGLLPAASTSPLSSAPLSKNRNTMLLLSSVAWGVALAYADEKLQRRETRK